MRAVLTLLLVIVSNAVLAHPEHAGGGAAGADLVHLLSEPDHLALLLLPAIVAFAIWRLRRAKSGTVRGRRRHSNI